MPSDPPWVTSSGDMSFADVPNICFIFCLHNTDGFQNRISWQKRMSSFATNVTDWGDRKVHVLSTVHDFIVIDPVILPHRINSAYRLRILQQTLGLNLANLPVAIVSRVLSPQDWGPPYCPRSLSASQNLAIFGITTAWNVLSYKVPNCPARFVKEFIRSIQPH